jgi:hypothetical protein
VGHLRRHGEPRPDLPELRRRSIRPSVGFTVAALGFGLLLVSPVASRAASEDSITPLDRYTTPKAKSLASTYRPQLVRLYEHVYYCLPWMDVERNGNGIGFRQPKGAAADERYLTLWVSVDQYDDGSFARMSRDRRASAMLSRYGVDLLRRMATMTPVGGDGNVTGYSVILSWLKPGSLPNPVKETLAFFVDKSTLGEYLGKRIASPEFLDRAKLAVFEGKETVGPVRLEVWEDSFNRTYKLPNYQPPADISCS